MRPCIAGPFLLTILLPSIGTNAYQPGDISTATGSASCNVYQLKEACASLEYTCIDYTALPQTSLGQGVDVGGFSSVDSNTVRYQVAANVRPMLEALHHAQVHHQRSATPSLATTLNAPPWGCQHMPLCQACCQPNNALPCCQRGKCCPRASCDTADGM